MTNTTLCRPTTQPQCRKTCARYCAAPSAAQTYINLDSGLGIRCKHRIDITNATTATYPWRDVDAINLLEKTA